jgi:hypothetical protein
MAELHRTDLQFVLSRVPSDVRDLVKERGLIIAGGLIRSVIAGERINDIDIFGPSKEALHDAAKDLALKRRAKLHETDNAFTVLAHPHRPVQFIHRWVFDDPQECCESFDFTIAQAAIYWDRSGGDEGHWATACADRFYSDLAAKRLYYTAPSRTEDAGGSIMRVRKFLKNGYNIQAPSLAGVIARLMWKVRQTDLADNSEKGLSIVITGLLREVDPLMVIDGVELVDEHKILSDEAPA